jgi:hypothetical protein
VETKTLDSLQIFQQLLKQYPNQIQEFCTSAKYPELHTEYQTAHPELRETVRALQIAFCDLPEELRSRLLELNFNVFISCDNDADLYNYRNFVNENSLIHDIFTLNVRLQTEVELAMEFIKQDKWDKYKYLPKREFKLYENLKQGGN